MSYRKVSGCRICGNPRLVEVLDLGVQALTGVFPRSRTQAITSGPLRLVKCAGDGDICDLLQLEHSYDSTEMYGDNYGYRSGLNPTMIAHLHGKVRRILERVRLEGNPLIVDIGSNDSTTLQAYPAGSCTLVGIDPTGLKFRQYYPRHIQLIPDFFSRDVLQRHVGRRKALVVTSFSMFYDLEDPVSFMREVADVLADNGIWVFEQSYMPAMLERNSFDTVCHEHVEYYGLRQIKWMTDKAGLKIVDVEFNDVNGGSFSVVAAKRSADLAESPSVAQALRTEAGLGLDMLRPYQEFAARTMHSRAALQEFVAEARRSNRTIAALGASTKGNVILQYCRLGETDIAGIGEVNEDKCGSFSPGTLIPIRPENEILASRPDYLLVLPWHFRTFFLENQKFQGRKLVFPLPTLEVCDVGPDPHGRS
jgi:hypothetical protein